MKWMTEEQYPGVDPSTYFCRFDSVIGVLNFNFDTNQWRNNPRVPILVHLSKKWSASERGDVPRGLTERLKGLVEEMERDEVILVEGFFPFGQSNTICVLLKMRYDASGANGERYSVEHCIFRVMKLVIPLKA
ncbi:hypothetical protein NMY22_g18904 [Coprinellus aureogranulatus]|nr:hypothetical protein NMY22_g18904 [Coprinellus aureogranulatus]